MWLIVVPIEVDFRRSFLSIKREKIWVQETRGSRGLDAVVKALASYQCGLGSIFVRCHMWVEFVVGSRPFFEGFSPCFSIFLPPHNEHSKFQFDLEYIYTP